MTYRQLIERCGFTPPQVLQRSVLNSPLNHGKAMTRFLDAEVPLQPGKTEESVLPEARALILEMMASWKPR